MIQTPFQAQLAQIFSAANPDLLIMVEKSIKAQESTSHEEFLARMYKLPHFAREVLKKAVDAMIADETLDQPEYKAQLQRLRATIP